MTAERRETSGYAVDAADVIVHVDSAWLEFARANGAADLTRDAVVGRSLWDFITGREMCFVYQMVLERIRAGRTPITLPFRCDSPEMRRFMQLRVEPDGDGGIRFTGVLLRADPRDRVALLDPREPRTRDFVEVCSWCKQVNAPAVGWVPVEDAIARMKLFEARRLPQINHSICRSCEADVWNELGDESGRSGERPRS